MSFIPDNISGFLSMNSAYDSLKKKFISEAVQEAESGGIRPQNEIEKIISIFPSPGNVDGENYWMIADFILAEYSAPLGFLVTMGFAQLAPSLGFNPFGKIMIGAQFVDRYAGSSMLLRADFAKRFPKTFSFVTEKDFPPRTEKAIDFLTVSLFQFLNADQLKELFPKAMVVTEMKNGVLKKLASLSPELANYIKPY